MPTRTGSILCENAYIVIGLSLLVFAILIGLFTVTLWLRPSATMLREASGNIGTEFLAL